jgi:hypothetical protein
MVKVKALQNFGYLGKNVDKYAELDMEQGEAENFAEAGLCEILGEAKAPKKKAAKFDPMEIKQEDPADQQPEGA